MPTPVGAKPYHHGNLRAALIAAAVASVEESGPAAVSLRDLARRVGVSHGAATHHFGDKAGLLTAVAIEGHELLAAELARAASTGTFLDVGIAYVRFAAERTGHFAVMFRAEFLRTDRAHAEAKARTWAVQQQAAGTVVHGSAGAVERAAFGAWAYAHGIATLWLDGNLPRRVRDPAAYAAELLPMLFGPATER